jgi:hypothetical protein
MGAPVQSLSFGQFGPTTYDGCARHVAIGLPGTDRGAFMTQAKPKASQDYSAKDIEVL